MKKIKILALSSLLTIGLFTSCEDAYNIVQDGELNENVAITSVADMQAYLNGIYANVSIGNEIAFTAIFTDEASIGRSTGGQDLDTHRFQLTPANGFSGGMWYGHYKVINRVNRILKAAQTNVEVPTNPSDLAAYNSILAQARALRAFSYLQLQSFYSTDMKNNSALGVIYLDRVPEVDEDLPRSSNAEIFDLIEDDLDFAYNNISTSLTYKFANRAMVNALRARMYLYRGNYVLAEQYAQDVIDNGGVSLTNPIPVPTGTIGSAAWKTAFSSPASTNPYRRMFADNDRGEGVFTLDRPGAQAWENIAGSFFFNTTSYNGGAFHEVGRKLYNLMSADVNDIRQYANLDPTSTIDPTYATNTSYFTSDVLVIDKYPGKTGFPLRNDLKVVRLSEMYFIVAECKARGGDYSGAAALIAQVKDKRLATGTSTVSYSNLTDALQGILLERRIELAFEGHRYVDLRRLGQEAGVSIDRDNTDDQILGLPLTISITDHRFTMPIPTDELNANPNIQQNPGY